MSEFYEGAEVQEVAEPVETQEESAEMQEVAEPASYEETASEGYEEDNAEVESENTNADRAFAEMRREKEAAERRAEEFEAQLSERAARRELLESIYGEDPEISAAAERLGIDPDELRQTIEEEEELERIKAENETLSAELQEHKVQEKIKTDLSEIQKIDPSIKTLQDLGKDFINYVYAGLSGVDAYFAIKAKEAKTKPTAPTEVGRVNKAQPPKDFYTETEVDAMSQEEVNKNLETIHKSMKKW